MFDKTAIRLIVKVTVALILLVAASAVADDREDRRAWVGLELFPTMLAADMDIGSRKSDSGKLTVLLVYTDEPKRARDMAAFLEKTGVVKGSGLDCIAVRPGELKQYNKLAGVFMVEKLPRALKETIRFCRERQVICFSPFAGDVEKGIAGGMLISDRIRPYINLESLHAAGIRLKPFYMRVAVVYKE